MTDRKTALLLALVLLTLAGCSYRYQVKVSGSISDASTGKPIDQVKVQLNGDDRPLADAVKCNGDGKFEFTVSASPYDIGRGSWKLVLSAAGYEDETVEIGPIERPSTGKEKTHIVVRAFMRPSSAAKPN